MRYITGPLVEEKAYYPFGLVLGSISSRAVLKAKTAYAYNAGSEWEENGVEYYHTFFRKYDAQIGRFTGVDIASEEYADLTPFQFGANNPVLFNDPFGDKLQLPAELYGTSSNPAMEDLGNDISWERFYWRNFGKDWSWVEQLQSDFKSSSGSKSDYSFIWDIFLSNAIRKINEPTLRRISMTVGSTPIGSAITFAYPDANNPNLYIIPTYELTVTGSSAEGNSVTEVFEVLRFGVNTLENGNIAVVGLANRQSYTIRNWISTYSVHSAESQELGAWQVNGNYLIHDGPDNPMGGDIYATAGCIEICGGPRGFDRFNVFLLNLSGARSLSQLGSSGIMRITFLPATRPPLVIYNNNHP